MGCGKVLGSSWCVQSLRCFEYWVSGQFPLMKVSFHNNTLWARCFEGEGNVRNLYRYIDNNCCNVAFS